MGRISSIRSLWPRFAAAAISIGVCVIAGICVFSASISTAATPLRIGGSGNAVGTAELLCAAFAEAHPEFSPVVMPSIGSSGAIKAVKKGALEVGLATRPLTDTEAGSGLTTLEYGRSPIVFAVNPQTKAAGITRQIAADIFAGKLTTWPDGTRIRPVLRQSGDDNTRKLAALSSELAQAIASAEQRPGLPFSTTVQDTVAKIETIKGAIGLTTLAAIHSEKRHLRALTFDGVEPSLANLRNGRYPLTKRFFLVIPKDPPPVTLAFVRFVQSAPGRLILEQNGHSIP